MILATIHWNTDAEGRPVEPLQDDSPISYYGPFSNIEAAVAWMDDYPEDTDVYDITADVHPDGSVDPDAINDPAVVADFLETMNRLEKYANDPTL